MMPRQISSGASERSVFMAPRGLKEPVTCRHSSFNRTRPSRRSLSCSASTMGVWRPSVAIRSAAARIAAISGANVMDLSQRGGGDHGCIRERALLDGVAGDEGGGIGAQLRPLGAAALVGEGAARMEGTARRWIDGVRHLAGHGLTLTSRELQIRQRVEQ